MNSINLISENYIKSNSALMQNVDSQLIVAHISEAQNIDYRSLIGKKLFNRIIAEFTAWSDAQPTKHEITDYISQSIIDLVNESQSYLMYRVLTNSSYSLATHLTNKGTTQQNSENTTNADSATMGRIEAKYSSRASSMAVQLIEFIEENSSDYPEYTSICDNSQASTSYLYLGEEI